MITVINLRNHFAPCDLFSPAASLPWVLAPKHSVLNDTESNEPNIIVKLLTDIILLTFIVHHVPYAAMDAALSIWALPVLWKQIRILAAAEAALHLPMCFPFQMVPFGSSLPLPPRLRQRWIQRVLLHLFFPPHYFTLHVFASLNLNGSFLFRQI